MGNHQNLFSTRLEQIVSVHWRNSVFDFSIFVRRDSGRYYSRYFPLGPGWRVVNTICHLIFTATANNTGPWQEQYSDNLNKSKRCFIAIICGESKMSFFCSDWPFGTNLSRGLNLHLQNDFRINTMQLCIAMLYQYDEDIQCPVCSRRKIQCNVRFTNSYSDIFAIKETCWNSLNRTETKINVN